MILLDKVARIHYRSWGFKYLCTLTTCDVMGRACIFQYDDKEYVKSFRNHYCNYELDRVLNNLKEL